MAGVSAKQLAERKLKAARKRANNRKKKERAASKQDEIQSRRDKNRIHMSEYRQLKRNTPGGRAQLSAQGRRYMNEYRASKRAEEADKDSRLKLIPAPSKAGPSMDPRSPVEQTEPPTVPEGQTGMSTAKAAEDKKRPEFNYVPVQLFGTRVLTPAMSAKTEVSASGKTQTSSTPSKRDAVDDLVGRLSKSLKIVTEVPWCLTPMKGRSVDATSRHAIQVSLNPANALGLDNYVFVEEASKHKDHFDLQEWEFQLKQPIGSECPITCPEYLSRKTGPTLVGVVNGSSENSKMLQLLHHPKRDGDCIAIYPLPQNRYYYDEDGPHGRFIPGSILEIDIVSSDNIVVIHLGKPRALPTIKNWDVWPIINVLGGSYRTSIRGEVYNDPRLPDGSKVSFYTARPIEHRRLRRGIIPEPRLTSGKTVVVEGYMGYRLGEGLEVNDWDVSDRSSAEADEYKYVRPPLSRRYVVNVKGGNFSYVSRRGSNYYTE